MKNMKVIFGALAVVAVLVAIAVFVLGKAVTGTPETVTVGTAFIGHLSAGDYDAAYDLTAAELQAEFTVGDLEAFVVEREALFTSETEIAVPQRGFDNEVRYLAGTLTSGDIEVPLYMEFVDDDGETRLIYFSFQEEDIPVIGDDF